MCSNPYSHILKVFVVQIWILLLLFISKIKQKGIMFALTINLKNILIPLWLYLLLATPHLPSYCIFIFSLKEQWVNELVFKWKQMDKWLYWLPTGTKIVKESNVLLKLDNRKSFFFLLFIWIKKKKKRKSCYVETMPALVPFITI